MTHVHCQNRGKRPTLRNDGRSRDCGRFLGRSDHEREGNAIAVIHHPKAVWPLHDNSVISRNAGQLLLRCSALLTAFSKTGRKHDETAHALARACTGGIHHGRPRNRKHRAIHVVRKILDRRKACPPVDLLALRINKIEIARVSRIFQVEQHAFSQRSRCG